jgi:hypothetical protein
MQERIRRDCDAALGPWSLGESEEQGQRMMMMMVEVLMVEAMMVEVMIMVSVVLRIGMSTLLLLMMIIIIINRWT